MATIHITCLDVDDYSHEDVLELDIRETETIGNLREIIKSSKLSFDNAKSFEVLKVNSSYNEINEKLAFLEDNSSVNIKKVLGGEELNATDKISEVFETEKNCIVLIEPRTLALLSNDGEIVISSNRLQIRCIKDDQEHIVGSFSKFIKLAITPSVIGSNNWKNLWIELRGSEEKLNWINFRRRMLFDQYNRNFEVGSYEDLTARISILNIKSDTLHDSVVSPCRTKDTNKVNTKGNTLITHPVGMENDETDVAYNDIRFGRSNISIDNHNVKDITSDFFSVNGEISYGIPENTHDIIDQIYNLLVEKKSGIDDILESQPVYFIGPSFHEFNNFPSITCWVTEPLCLPVLEQLEKLFDGKFRVVSQMMETTDGGSSNNTTSGGSSGDSANNKETPENKDFEGKDDKDDEEKNGDSHSGGDDNHEKYESNTRSRNSSTINISSISFADYVTNQQVFTINVKFYAKIIRDEESGGKLLIVHTDVTECRTSELLSRNCVQLSQLGYGYSLETVKIGISPITNAIGNREELCVRKDYNPKEKYISVDTSTGVENLGGLEVGTAVKLGFQGKNSNITKVTSDEMQLRTWGGHISGDHWGYEKKSNNAILSFEPGLHSCEWYLMEKMHGFCVKITQVLCFKFNDKGWAYLLKPKLVKCPMISHTLEIKFNDLEGFNEKFARLKYFHKGAEELIFDVEKNKMPNPTTQLILSLILSAISLMRIKGTNFCTISYPPRRSLRSRVDLC
ncbi:15928_t:CDS:2 [Rhizophagus irregularis]|nr:15928_t:CDS:2 [Rhizophagus irregularis]